MNGNGNALNSGYAAPSEQLYAIPIRNKYISIRSDGNINILRLQQAVNDRCRFNIQQVHTVFGQHHHKAQLFRYGNAAERTAEFAAPAVAFGFKQ